MSQWLRIERTGVVRTLLIDRPEKRNALHGPLLDDLLSQFSSEPAADERVVVLRGAGKVFCAGLDLGELAETGHEAASFEQLVHAVEAFPLPTVAVVHGDAYAGGCELALHCDLVVASDQARFGMPLAQFGFAPGWAFLKKLIDYAGPAAAREMLLLGDPLPAARMHALGCIARCVPAEELEQSVAQVVDRLTRNAPLSLRAMKAALVRLMDFREQMGHDEVDALIARVQTSHDLREGLAARRERRQPEFSGH